MGLNDKQISGQRLKITASDWNAVLDAARKARDAERFGSEDTAAPRSSTLCKIRNVTEADFDRNAIVGLTVPLILPTESAPQFLRRLAFDAVAPEVGTHEGLFAITLTPIGAGRIGEAIIAGVSQCRLAVPGDLDGWAEIADGQTGYLTSDPDGSARILWAEDSGSERWALVRLADRAPLLTQMSITSDADGLLLVGDEFSPGNSKLYGTDSSGTKGWYAQPGSSVHAVTLGSTQNDYDWGSYDQLIITTSSAVLLSGLVAASTNGRRLRLTNVGPYNVLLYHQSSSSSAANRILTQNAATRVLVPQESVDLFYDTTQARWLLADYWLARERWVRATVSIRGG